VQFLGAGDEKISLSGSVYAEITDGRVSLDQLREMADQGEALPLLDGSGLVRQLRDRGDRRAPRRAHGRWPPAADRLCHRPSARR
jgi:hypothetical protein